MVEQENNDNFEKVRQQMIEVQLTDQRSFSRIVEVLTRIGIPSYKTHTLYQTAHILHKRHKYYIVHFKSMLALDGKSVNITQDDIDRLQTIALMLEQWNLCKCVDKFDKTVKSSILVIPRKDLQEWELVPKYNIGHHHNY